MLWKNLKVALYSKCFVGVWLLYNWMLRQATVSIKTPKERARARLMLATEIACLNANAKRRRPPR